MALPTLQPYWMKSYKNRSEGLMVRRQQNEADRRDMWDRNARYFDRSDVETTKQRAWGSKESYFERFVNSLWTWWWSLFSSNLSTPTDIILKIEIINVHLFVWSGKNCENCKEEFLSDISSFVNNFKICLHRFECACSVAVWPKLASLNKLLLSYT